MELDFRDSLEFGVVSFGGWDSYKQNLNISIALFLELANKSEIFTPCVPQYSQ